MRMESIDVTYLWYKIRSISTRHRYWQYGKLRRVDLVRNWTFWTQRWLCESSFYILEKQTIITTPRAVNMALEIYGDCLHSIWQEACDTRLVLHYLRHVASKYVRTWRTRCILFSKDTAVCISRGERLREWPWCRQGIDIDHSSSRCLSRFRVRRGCQSHVNTTWCSARTATWAVNKALYLESGVTCKSQPFSHQPTMQIRPGTPNSIASSHTAASIHSTTTITNEMLSVSLSSDPVDKTVLITVTPPPRPAASSEKSVGRRAPLDICCVIDVSGSMNDEASIPADPTTGKPAESNGLSVLDVVKHSLRTIVTTMQEGELQ